MFCFSILEPITIILRTVIQVVRQIVRTVCEWVSSVITVIKEVVEKVCKWLPWPLNKLCDWVTKTIEVLQTVWDWVCEEVIETIIDWIELLIEYVIYVLKWICWVIDWIIRLPGLILCWMGVRPVKFIGVCVKILADEAGNPAIPLDDVREMMRDAGSIFRNCNINLIVCGFDVVIKPEYLDSTTCEFSGMFRRFFTWFSANGCGCCSTVTVYFVRDIQAASGCAYPGSNWVTVDADGDGTVVVQEIGHLADLWAHSDDPDNVMTDQSGGSHDQITENQCCMIRTSRFVKFTPFCSLKGFRGGLLQARLDQFIGKPFNRKERKKH